MGDILRVDAREALRLSHDFAHQLIICADEHVESIVVIETPLIHGLIVLPGALLYVEFGQTVLFDEIGHALIVS